MIVGFFDLSNLRLPGYLQPVFPALALLEARWSASATSEQLEAPGNGNPASAALRSYFPQLDALRPLGSRLAMPDER